MAAIVTVVGLPLLVAAYIVGVLLLKRWIALLLGRNVMDGFRPDRHDVADTDRRIDDIHYEVVVGE